jgi:cob(I)alamin adenosyltransferase
MRRGLVILYTGDGKGKTTAALGLLLRAWGRGLRVGVIQFVKAETGSWGEVKAARRLGIEWHITGRGFTWQAEDLDPSKAAACQGWQLAQEKIAGGGFDLLILDEFTYPLQLDWLDATEVIAWLRQNKPAFMHLVITGRNAPPRLVEYADLVTEMNSIKHPFEQGVKAQPGIEF